LINHGPADSARRYRHRRGRPLRGLSPAGQRITNEDKGENYGYKPELEGHEQISLCSPVFPVELC
jgi:hypothetical protein